jgi:hypothetical protein
LILLAEGQEKPAGRWSNYRSIVSVKRSVSRKEKREKTTYASGCTSSNIVRQSRSEHWVTHEDGSFDHIHGRRRQLNSGVGVSLVGIAAATQGNVHDLATLAADVSVILRFVSCGI